MANWYRTVVAYGDRHYPFHSPVNDALLIELIKLVKPSVIIDGGDGVDASCLGRYPKDPDELTGLQAQLDGDYRFRDRINKAAPTSAKILLSSNHFDRRLADRKKDSPWTRDLRSLEATNLLRLNELGWELRNEVVYGRFPATMFIHGDGNAEIAAAKAPVNAARSLSITNMASVVRFHSHTSGIEYFSRFGEGVFALQVGCLCNIEQASHYTKHKVLNNWTNSIAVLRLTKDGTIVSPELVMIEGGMLQFGTHCLRYAG